MKQQANGWLWRVGAAVLCVAVGHAAARAQVVGPNDPDGRMTAAERAQAGAGAPVTALAPASSLTSAQQKARLAQWRKQIRAALYIPDPLPKLGARTWSSFSPMPGVRADRVTYGSSDEMIVPAIVYYPDPALSRNSGKGKGQGKLPGIVIVNGHGGDKYSWYAMYSGMLFAKAGAVVVTYDPIGEGERNSEKLSRTGAHDRWISPPMGLPRTDWGQRLDGLMQTDVMQAVSYLRSRHDVDVSRIGVAGYSMGGFIVGITGAIDQRIHAVVISGGGVYDGPGGYFDANPLPCQMPPYKALLPLGDRGAVLYALNAERGPMLVMNGSDDTVMDIAHHPPAWFADERERASQLVGPDSPAAKNLFTTIVYPGISHRPSWVDRDGVAWLNEQLRFAFWDAATIAAEPTTRIGAWVKENHVDEAKGFGREDREAGIDALGTGFPALTREDLTVLPDDAWRREKSRLTYEGWAATMTANEAKAAQ